VSSGKILVIDVGTSSVRSAIVDAESSVSHVVQRAVLPSTPEPGMVEINATEISAAVIETAQATLAAAGPVASVGIANQRATTVIWDKTTGVPIGPALGWQDLRTVINCLILQGEGLRLAPNVSATKAQWLLDTFDPERARVANLLFGTIDTWVTWNLSKGERHITDATNAAVTGMLDVFSGQWDQRVLDILKIPLSMMPEIVDSSGELATASALVGSPVIAGIAGDQQAALIGQGCTAPGMAKITFGTGGMLDMVTGSVPPTSAVRSQGGTFPIVAWQRNGAPTWGLEAIMLSAGSCVEWLRDDLGIIGSAEESAAVAGACGHSDGVVFVPALLGLGTPTWDFGARGLLLGITRGTGRPQITRAVLEGIAQRGRDLVDAAEADSGFSLPSVRIDGGMSANDIFVEALANALDRPVEISPVLEATTLGAGYLAGIASGLWKGESDLNAAWKPRAIIEPTLDTTSRETARSLFLEARMRSEQTIPDLSGVSF
jgi:glycerol kinase